MTPERWRQIQTVFDAAVRCDAARREALLAERCAGDPELRAQVDERLSHDAAVHVGGFLPTPPDGPAGEKAAPRRVLGDFEIVREIGRGGMGVVYEARQLSLDRRVALKVLAAGIGVTAQGVQRFRRESHAAARLHHTNIVPVAK